MEKETLEEFKGTMSIFYGSFTGDIYGAVGGKQSAEEFYGDSFKDYNLKTLITDFDGYVLDNIYKFKVEDERIILKENPELLKYLSN